MLLYYIAKEQSKLLMGKIKTKAKESKFK